MSGRRRFLRREVESFPNTLFPDPPKQKFMEPIELGDEYDDNNYREQIRVIGQQMTINNDKPAVLDLALCWVCQSNQTYKCCTKNRMFCWACGSYYGSSH